MSRLLWQIIKEFSGKYYAEASNPVLHTYRQNNICRCEVIKFGTKVTVEGVVNSFDKSNNLALKSQNLLFLVTSMREIHMILTQPNQIKTNQTLRKLSNFTLLHPHS